MGKIINSVSPFGRKFILIPNLLEKKKLQDLWEVIQTCAENPHI